MKYIKNIAFVITISFILLSCGQTSSKTSKCDLIDCSNKGECIIDNGYTKCICEEGYYPRGEDCVEYSCRDGYTLEGTNCIKTCLDCPGKDSYLSDPCEGQECSDNGFCTSDIDRVIYCLCYPGYKNESGISCVESDCDGVSCASK